MLMIEDFVAYPSRWRTALYSLGSLGLAVTGLWMVGAFGDPPTARYPPIVVTLVGVLSVIFFGACAVLWANRLFVTAEQLRIGREGVRWTSWSDSTIPWSEISKITTWKYKSQKLIILHLYNPSLFPGRGTVAMFAGVNRKLTGGDVALALTGTDRSVEDALAAVRVFQPAAL
jgi:hypothetical protein